LIVIAGFIHDVSDFIEEHPGGAHLLIKNIGKDATTAFFGGVYDHSNAAHNVSTSIQRSSAVVDVYSQLLSMKRVGVLHGGSQTGVDEKAIPPSQRLRIARYNELSASPYNSGTGYSDSEGLLG
jgi:stearoyl-CoA desaturase (delta-9 desaturase)